MQDRILFVNHSAMLGGGELSLLDIATHYKDSCTVVVFEKGPLLDLLRDRAVVTLQLRSTGTAPKISRSTGLLKALLAVPWVIIGTVRLVRATRGHRIIYANSQKAFVLAAFAGRIVAKPVVWHLRDLLSSGHFSKSLRRLVIWLANHCAVRVLVNSRATAGDFINEGGDSALLRIVYNGIASGDYSSLTFLENREIRLSLGLGDNDQVVGMFSRLAPWKGQDVFLEALAMLPGIHGIVVGAALFGEDGYAEQLVTLADRLGIKARVHFLGFRHDIPRLTQAVDVVIHASVQPEPFGRVIVEGMLAAKPVLASAGGGVDEIIENGIDGFIVPPGDPKAIAAKIRLLLNDPALARTIGLAGREKARTKFSLDAMLTGVSKAIENIV